MVSVKEPLGKGICCLLMTSSDIPMINAGRSLYGLGALCRGKVSQDIMIDSESLNTWRGYQLSWETINRPFVVDLYEFYSLTNTNKREKRE